MAYYHGVRTQENATSMTVPIEGTAGLQVVFGTAPVNMADNPYSVTNKLVYANKYEEAVAALGYSSDFKKYTLCQSMDVTFNQFAVAPIILINVLDPTKHVATVDAASYTVTNSQATINILGLLLDKLVVKNGDSELTVDTDFVASFDDDGYVLITLLSTGAGASATALTVSGIKLDPSAVESSDIIGGYDTSTGLKTGVELVRDVYPTYGVTPGLLLAPGFSKDPNVAAALAGKCEGLNGVFSCEAIVDLDCTSDGATKYSDVKSVKESAGLISKYEGVMWPKVKIGSNVYYYSAVYAACTAYTDAQNDDVPSISASNKALPVTALCLDDDDDTEIVIDREDANVVNSYGVITAINQNGFRTWGNNTAIYPSSTDPKDRWINCRRFFSWWGNSFILTYTQKVDDNANKRLIQSIVDAENIRGNAYAAQGKIAGAKMVYNEDENPITNILNGKLKFHQYLAPYTPAEDILNVLEFDPSLLESALGGE